MRYLTAGESHGKGLIGIIEGMPAGLKVDTEFINAELKRRMRGYGRGDRMKIEDDEADIWSGVRGGITLGSPIAFIIPNRDYEKWMVSMHITKAGEGREVTAVRPGHADYAGCVKYGFSDARNVLERASARETAARTTAGAFAKLLLRELGITVSSYVTGILDVVSTVLPEDSATINEIADLSPVRCLDKNAEKEMMKRIDECKAAGDTAGGTARIVVSGLQAGFGSHVHYDRKLTYRLAAHLQSLQSVKGVSFGLGFESAKRAGSQVHDEMHFADGKVFRSSNNAGGLEGGISNGEDILINVAFKPIPTLMKGMSTFDIRSGEDAVTAPERSDVCAVPAASVVAENIAAFAIAEEILFTLGGDTMDEVIERYEAKKHSRVLL